MRAQLDLTFVDHGFIRAVYCNRHRVGAKLWRSAQPGPGHLRWAKRHGRETAFALSGVRIARADQRAALGFAPDAPDATMEPAEPSWANRKPSRRR